MASYAKEPLNEVLLIFAHLAAGVDGSGPVKKGDLQGVVGAGGVGEQVGGLVDADGSDPRWCDEGLDVGVLGELDSAVHELCPDGCGRVCALQSVGEAGR